MLIKYIKDDEFHVTEVKEITYNRVGDVLHVMCKELGLHVTAPYNLVPDFEKYMRNGLPLVNLSPPVFDDAGSSLPIEKAVSWFAGLSLEQAKQLAAINSRLFNGLVERDPQRITDGGEFLSRYMETVRPAHIVRDGKKADWEFVSDFMKWFRTQDDSSLPVGYSAVWELAINNNYAGLLDVGEEMLYNAKSSVGVLGGVTLR